MILVVGVCFYTKYRKENEIPTDGMLMQNGWCGMIGKGWKNHPVCVRMQRSNMMGNKDRSVRKVRHE